MSVRKLLVLSIAAVCCYAAFGASGALAAEVRPAIVLEGDDAMAYEVTPQGTIEALEYSSDSGQWTLDDDFPSWGTLATNSGVSAVAAVPNVSGDPTVFYVDANGSIDYVTGDESDGFSYDTLDWGEPAQTSDTPAALYNPGTGSTEVFYIGTDGNMWLYEFDSNGESNFQLTGSGSLSGWSMPAPVALGTSLEGSVASASNESQVFYVTSTDHLASLGWYQPEYMVAYATQISTGTSTNRTMTVEPGTVPGVPAASPYTGTSLYFAGTDKQLYWADAGYNAKKVTGTMGVAQGTGPGAAYINGSIDGFFTGSGGPMFVANGTSSETQQGGDIDSDSGTGPAVGFNPDDGTTYLLTQAWNSDWMAFWQGSYGSVGNYTFINDSDF